MATLIQRSWTQELRDLVNESPYKQVAINFLRRQSGILETLEGFFEINSQEGRNLFQVWLFNVYLCYGFGIDNARRAVEAIVNNPIEIEAIVGIVDSGDLDRIAKLALINGADLIPLRMTSCYRS